MDTFRADRDRPGYVRYSSEVAKPVTADTYKAFFERVSSACRIQGVVLGEGTVIELPGLNKTETVLYLRAPVASGNTDIEPITY